jgi:hypothetical protein
MDFQAWGEVTFGFVLLLMGSFLVSAGGSNDFRDKFLRNKVSVGLVGGLLILPVGMFSLYAGVVGLHVKKGLVVFGVMMIGAAAVFIAAALDPKVHKRIVEDKGWQFGLGIPLIMVGLAIMILSYRKDGKRKELYAVPAYLQRFQNHPPSRANPRAPPVPPGYKRPTIEEDRAMRLKIMEPAEYGARKHPNPFIEDFYQRSKPQSLL